MPARQYHTQQVHYLRKTLNFSDASAVTVGVLPAGASIIPAMSGALVTTVFNAATTNVIDIGTSADDDLYATDLAGGSLGFKPLDEAVSFTVAADTTITATYAQTGTAATTGVAEIVICYIPDNDG